MMKSGPFIKVVSESYGIDEKTVSVFARFLKDAGLLSMGARGINAPHMTPLDAARLTIALLATDRPSRAVELARLFGNLTVNKEYTSGAPPEFASNPDWAAALEDVLTEFFTGSSKTFLEIDEVELCEQTKRAVVTIRQKIDAEQQKRGIPLPRLVEFDGVYHDEESARNAHDYYGRRTKRSLVKVAFIPVVLALKEGLK